MTVPLTDAPVHVKLAVEIIMLLEQNQIPETTALAALEIVKQDLQTKTLKQQNAGE